MISVGYVVCSESQKKPLVRAFCRTRAEAEHFLEKLQNDERDGGTTHWMAELGPESAAWAKYFDAGTSGLVS